MRSFLLAIVLALPMAAQLRNNELGIVFGHAVFKEDVAGESSADALGLSYNRYWTPAISTRFSAIELGVDTFRVDLGSRSFDMNAYSAALEYHLRRDRLFAPYAGIGVALVSSTIGSRFVDAGAEAELTALATAGVDVNLFRRFAAGFDATYMPYRPDYPTVGELELNPLTISATLKFRW
jgi:outer membrane protein W